MLEKKPFKSQFAITFFLILISSIITTIATYVAGYLIYMNLEYKKVYPANYFERKMPEIEEEIRNKGTNILNPEAKRELEKLIPTEGISYQVLWTQAATGFMEQTIER